MRLNTPLCTLTVFALSSAHTNAGLVTLDVAMTVDNQFTAYISTDANMAGDSFMSGGSWPTTDFGSYDFENAGTYYLHVLAVDTGSPEMFIGSFGLSNTSGWFSNSTQSLLTGDTGDWSASITGWGGVDVGINDLAPNGTAPWGNFAAMGDARFIWANSSEDTVYFSTEITIVPHPGSVAALGLGGCMIARRRR